jgi:signal transduction histidine kinase
MFDTVTKFFRQSFGIRLVLILVFLNGTLMLWVFFAAMDSKQGYEERARQTTQNMARLVDQSVNASVARIDLTLLSAVYELEHQLRQLSRLDAPQSNAFLLTQQKRLTELSSLRVADASGLVILGDGVSVSKPASWADRDFFGALRERTDLGLVVTNPILGRVNNIWIISFVRRYNKPDGGFAGVVSASIPVSYLGTLLSAMDVGPNGIALLRDANLAMIVRHPALNTPTGAIGAKGFSQELRNGIESGLLEFNFHSKTTADSVERTGAYRRMSGVPFHIVVGQGSADYLAAWTVGIQRAIGSLVFFLLISSAFGWLLWRAQAKKVLADAQREKSLMQLQQKTEALARSNAELEQFAYVTSHDLRQPLRMVNSYMQLLERALADKLDDETRQMMHFAAEGARRMDQMLVSLLEYSRVGHKGEPMQALASREALDEALHFLAPSIADAQATVRVSGDCPKVLASRDEFTRLWQNLISNAIKYRNPEHAPEIDITVTPEPHGGWRFCVADNGIGIDPAQVDRLFKVFQRLHTREQYEGNGIGLAVARKIVERHGGHIWIESDGAGKGSRFCFTLPQLPFEHSA